MAIATQFSVTKFSSTQHFGPILIHLLGRKKLHSHVMVVLLNINYTVCFFSSMDSFSKLKTQTKQIVEILRKETKRGICESF